MKRFCQAEDCKETALEPGRLCRKHTEMLFLSKAFWHAGRLTLDPMPANEAQLGLAGSRTQR